MITVFIFMENMVVNYMMYLKLLMTIQIFLIFLYLVHKAIEYI